MADIPACRRTFFWPTTFTSPSQRPQLFVYLKKNFTENYLPRNVFFFRTEFLPIYQLRRFIERSKVWTVETAVQNLIPENDFVKRRASSHFKAYERKRRQCKTRKIKEICILQVKEIHRMAIEELRRRFFRLTYFMYRIAVRSKMFEMI